MSKSSRQSAELHFIQEKGHIETIELANHLGVSPITIRRDLEELQELGLLKRVHGGAKFQDKMVNDITFDERLIHNQAYKQAIAKMAIQISKDDRTILIDAGTTTLSLSQELNQTTDRIIITNSLTIANDLCQNQSLTVFSIGGEVRPNSKSTFGLLTEESIAKFNADSTFIGASGIDSSGNLYCVNLTIAAVKRAMLANCRKAYAVIDSSKIGVSDLYTFCNMKKDNVTLITDSGADSSFIAQLRDIGIDVVVAPK